VVDAADGAVWALEINTSPGVQPGGNLPTAAAWAGIAYADLVRHLVAESMARGNRAPWHPVSA
jgi:D-alanine-D-alanine ligase-like ATP-grasp enzyme